MKEKFFLAILFGLSLSVSCQKPIQLPIGVVIGNGNAVPVVVVGSNQVITLPTNSTAISGTATDPNGTITSTLWTQVYGPNTAVIASPSSLTTTVSGMVAGTYTFRLTATDNLGATAFNELSVVVQGVDIVYNDTLDLYISAGQSNMDGRANDFYPYATESLTLLGGGVQVWSWHLKRFNSFEYDRFNGGQSYATPRWAGDVVAMKKLRDSVTGTTVYFMKATLGGSSLHPFNASVGNWTIPQDSIAPGRRKMFDTLKIRFNDIKSIAASQGKYLRVKAIIWHQGESDKGAYAAAYEYRLTQLFNAIRSEIGQGNVPIIMGTIPVASTGYDATVRSAQVKVAQNLSNIYLINLDGQPLQSDNLHLNGTAQQYFGDQIFNILKTL